MTNPSPGKEMQMFATNAKRLAVLAAVAAMIGGGSTSLAVASHHHMNHHRGIPQHNGGDHDGDNNGGPSDGDGRI
jgi:hypothetical protein